MKQIKELLSQIYILEMLCIKRAEQKSDEKWTYVGIEFDEDIINVSFEEHTHCGCCSWDEFTIILSIEEVEMEDKEWKTYIKKFHKDEKERVKKR